MKVQVQVKLNLQPQTCTGSPLYWSSNRIWQPLKWLFRIALPISLEEGARCPNHSLLQLPHHHWKDVCALFNVDRGKIYWGMKVWLCNNIWHFYAIVKDLGSLSCKAGLWVRFFFHQRKFKKLHILGMLLTTSIVLQPCFYDYWLCKSNLFGSFFFFWLQTWSQILESVILSSVLIVTEGGTGDI